MSTICEKCGAALAERGTFCTACGARKSPPGATAGARRFCTRCGALLGGTKFCVKCGVPADVASGVSPMTRVSVVPARSSATGADNRDAAQLQAAVATVTPVATSEAPEVSSHDSTVLVAQSSRIPKLAIIAVVILVLLFGGVFVGVSYVVHRVRQKATQLEARPETETSRAPATSGDQSRQNPRPRTPLEELRSNLSDLQRAAPDNATSVELAALQNKLYQLDIAVRQYPNDQKAKEDLNKGISDITAEAAKLAPAIAAATDAALTPPLLPSGAPMTPAAGTGDPKHDWPLEYERTVGGTEADLVVRTGDINNLGFGWPSDFDPFSGNSTPPHNWPSMNGETPPQSPPGTDRIMLGTGVTPVHMSLQHTPGRLDHIRIDSVTATTRGDGYSTAMQACYSIGSLPDSVMRYQTTDHITLPPNYDESILTVPTQAAASCVRQRQLTMPTPIVLSVGELPGKIDSVIVQIFVDDFQAPLYHSYFQVSLNGTRIPSFEDVINSLDQSGPIGKLVSMRLLPEYWPLLKSGTVNLLIDDPTTHVQDGYAVDFVRILVNPHKFQYQVSLAATVTDADKHAPIVGATVNAALQSAVTDSAGKCELKGIPAGLVVATATAPGYDDGSVAVDLSAGQAGRADILLHAHQESTAALEKSIAQTGMATIYGIHFDTDSSTLRADSMPALNAVLGLINGRSGSRWIIAGHTDNQGSDALNIPLSKARAASVISWLTAHGIASNRLEPDGFGATRPVADNATANGRALNRRVEVSLAK